MVRCAICSNSQIGHRANYPLALISSLYTGHLVYDYTSILCRTTESHLTTKYENLYAWGPAHKATPDSTNAGRPVSSDGCDIPHTMMFGWTHL